VGSLLRNFFRSSQFLPPFFEIVYLAILDIMLLNSWIAWNMSVEERGTSRRHLDRHEFFWYVAQSLLNYREPDSAPSPEQVRKSNAHLFIGESVHVPRQSSIGVRCIVCRLESNWIKKLGQEKMTVGVGTCKCCGIDAHTSQLCSSNRKIHRMKAFANLTCFQIAHTPLGMDLLRRVSTGKGSYQVNTKHEIYLQLREQHGLERSTKKKSKKKRALSPFSTISVVQEATQRQPVPEGSQREQSSDMDELSTIAGSQSQV
jgi:hypothetical protein